MKNLPTPSHWYFKLAIIAFLTTFYFFAGKLGLSLAFVNPSASAVWPAAGIAVAAFLLLGEYVWPSILLGAFLVNYSTTGSVLPSFTIALGNTLEGVAGAYLVNRFAHGTHAFEQTQDVLKFALLAGVVATAISANIGVASLVWSGLAPRTDYLIVWLTWWLGDAAGVMIVAPFLILWATPATKRPRWTSAHTLEGTFLLFSLTLMALVIFTNQSPFGIKNYPLEFTLAPWILWVAFRFRQRETASVIAFIASIAIWGTLQGFGPFARDVPHESLLLLQSFMGITSVVALCMAAMASEHKEIEGSILESNNRLMQNVEKLEQHNNKMIRLNEMRDLLQSCITLEEAYIIIGQLGKHLFSEESGAVYMINNSQSFAEAVVSWGNPLPEQDTFKLDECWALRRGRVHSSHENGLELICPHLKNRPPLAALCIPLIAQGEAMGILHLQSETRLNGAEQTASFETQQLALAMADTIALALANLKLRTSLLNQSIRDPLTDLFNRRYLEETLEREVHRAARLQRSVAVMMLDIDHFKRFNDTFGHEAGDIVLKALGHFLKSQIRGGDFACRYGGEEFTLIFPEMSLANTLQRAEMLRNGVKDLHLNYQGKELNAITISLGIAIFPEHGINTKMLLQMADAALYKAKHKGRDCAIVAPSDDATMEALARKENENYEYVLDELRKEKLTAW